METVFHRFKKEEVKIEAWESRRRAKIESEMRRIEVQFQFIVYPQCTWLSFFENGLYLTFSAQNPYSKFLMQ